MTKHRVFFCAMLLAAAAAAGAQTFDTSGNGMLNGPYFTRQLSLGLTTGGTISRAFAVWGTITFDGKGAYSFTGQLLDSRTNTPQSYAVTGTYAVESNGLAQVQSLLESQQFIYGGVAQSIFSGSSTESQQLNDILIAIPAGSGGNTAVQGAFAVGHLEFLASDGTPRDSFFTLNAAGTGKFSDIALKGSAANAGSTEMSQTISGPTYSISSGSGTATFPASNGTSSLVSGTKVLYVSADGNTILGGGTNTYDIFVGIRPATGSAGNGTFQGTYFLAGLEDNTANPPSGAGAFDSFAGSSKAIGNGKAITHIRLNSVFDGIYDYTYDLNYTVALDGTVTQDFFHYNIGANGQSVLIVGRGSEYELAFGPRAPGFSGGGVYLNPVGIVNAAGMAPVTNSVSPGEFVTLYGTGLASSTLQASSLPFPNMLGNVQVTVNGRPAPVYFVSPGQISVLVPYATSETYATFQVINNGAASNSVTLYVNRTSPGVFSLNQTGYGPAAVLHANNTLVSAQNPARGGETVQIFLTGLGAVSPAVTDGAPAPAQPLSLVVADVSVRVNGTNSPVTFKGLAPGFAGLYQINATIPTGLTAGDVYLDVSTPDALQSEVTIAVAP